MAAKEFREQEALAALQEGKEQGLTWLFEEYYAPLTLFAYRLLKDRFLAAETAEYSFAKLWSHRERLYGHTSIKAWLYQSVRNACIDQLRKTKRIVLTDDMAAEIQDAEQRTVLHHLIEAEMMQQIIKAMEALPPACARVFQLCYLEGKKDKEVAGLLQLSASTVRTQKARALRMLRAKLPPSFLFCTLFFLK